MTRSTSTLYRVLVASVLVVMTATLVVSASIFTPASAHIFDFNSDDAIPLMMANEVERGLSLFDVYYYGQNRFGAWPFLILRLLGQTVGHVWSIFELSAIQQAFWWLALLPLAGLFGPMWLSGLALFVAAFFYSSALCGFFLGTQFAFAWQVPWLLLGWWLFRRGYESSTPPSWRSAVLLFTATFFATWSANISGPLLLWLGISEFAGAFALNRASARRLWLLVPAALAVLSEMLLQRVYREDPLFEERFTTKVVVDHGHIVQNLTVSGIESLNSTWPAWLFLGLVIGGWLIINRLKLGSGDTKPGIMAGMTFVGALGCAVINLLALNITTWSRDGLFHPRFRSLSVFFVCIGVCAAACWVAAQIRTAHMQWVNVAVATAALSLAATRLPTQRPSVPFSDAMRAAEQIATLGVQVVLGGYWGSYVMTVFLHDRVHPVVVNGDHDRTAWTHRALGAAEEILVNHYHTSAFGSSAAPPSCIQQYGVSFKLIAANVVDAGRHQLSKYKRVRECANEKPQQ